MDDLAVLWRCSFVLEVGRCHVQKYTGKVFCKVGLRWRRQNWLPGSPGHFAYKVNTPSPAVDSVGQYFLWGKVFAAGPFCLVYSFARRREGGAAN